MFYWNAYNLNFESPGILLSILASSQASASHLQEYENVNIAKTFGVLSAELRDSFLYPLILNPLQINKLTCGSVLTLYDNSSDDITVAADICLITLLIGKLMVLLPLILENLNVDLESGVFGVIGNFQEGVNKVQSGVDTKLAVLEKPIEALAGFPDKLKAFGENAASSLKTDAASYSPPQAGYQAPVAEYGAPASSYSSSAFYNLRKNDDYDYTNTFESRKDNEVDVDYVDLSQIKEEDLADYYNLPRSFQVGKLEKILQGLLHQLEGAFTISKH